MSNDRVTGMIDVGSSAWSRYWLQRRMKFSNQVRLRGEYTIKPSPSKDFPIPGMILHLFTTKVKSCCTQQISAGPQ